MSSLFQWLADAFTAIIVWIVDLIVETVLQIFTAFGLSFDFTAAWDWFSGLMDMAVKVNEIAPVITFIQIFGPFWVIGILARVVRFIFVDIIVGLL